MEEGLGKENLVRGLVDGSKILLHFVERLAGQGIDDVNRPLERLDDRQCPFGGVFDRVLSRRQGSLDQTRTRLLSVTRSKNMDLLIRNVVRSPWLCRTNQRRIRWPS
jgi:hypothetical protein